MGRLRFFSAYVAAQVLTLCGLLVAFLVVQFGPLPPIGLADFGFIGTAHAQLLHGGDPLRSVMTLTAFGLVLICLGAYALSIYVMFLSPRPTRAQVDLAKFYSGFCTGLLTHLFSMTTT